MEKTIIIIINTLLVLGVIISMYTDIKDNKILNVVTFPLFILGFILNMIINPVFDGFLFSLWGVLLAYAIFIIPYLTGHIGAGDVKLLMAIGALKGWYFTFYTFILMGIVGLVVSLFILIKNRVLIDSLIYLVSFGKLRTDSKEYLEKAFPYGIAIGLGALISLVMEVI